ncbi:MAG TPA: VOC family protein [Kofleriaceae bacterium]|jgi:catechol 2,3-dioxygenase-like lactoylglutathione lyase family enzyme
MTAVAQPLIYVRNVRASSNWYCAVLGAKSGHGGDEYERIQIGDDFVVQLHSWDDEHHHGTPGDPTKPVGNGLLLWFAVDDFDATHARIDKLGASIHTARHVNPNAQQWEVWLRDPDGYIVVIAGPAMD